MKVIEGDTIVGVEDEEVSRQRPRVGLPQLRGQQQARRPQELQLTLADRAYTQEPVDVRHRQGKHFFLATSVFAHLHQYNNRYHLLLC